MGVQSIDAEDDQFAYRYDTQLLKMISQIILQNILKVTV